MKMLVIVGAVHTHTHTHTHTRAFTNEIIARNSDLFAIPEKRNLTYNQEF